jgi:TP901 family phage tail tape measure protein
MSKKFSIEAIFSAKDRLSAPIAKLTGKLAGLGRAGDKALRGLDKAASKTLGGLQRFGKEIGVGAVLSLGALGFEMRNVMEHGAELEKTLIRTGSAFEKPVRVGTEGFEKLNAAARGVGAQTEFSAQQGAESLNSLATAGYNLEQSIAALPKVIDFASAATLELGAASDITSDTLGAFNLRTADATKNAANMARVMDTLTRTAADSTTNVTELFEGIRAGGAFAATAGASLEQYAALQGVLANKGFKGAEAGTAIRNSYLHLTKQTKEAKEAQAKLGVVTAKNKDGSIDLMTTIGRFTKATQKLTRAKKAEAIATIFGAYTVGPFLALMDAGEGTIKAFTKNLEGATGVTQEMAAAMRESKAAKIARFFNVLENVRLTVFEAIAPAVLDIANAIGKWVTANEKLIATKAGEWATKLRDNLPEIATWLERIAKAATALLVLSAVVKAFSALVTVVTALSTAFAWLEFVALLTGTTLAATVGWVVLIGAAVAGVVYLLYSSWPQISGFFVDLYEWAVARVRDMWAGIVRFFEAAKGPVLAVFEFIAGVGALLFAPVIAGSQWAAKEIGAFGRDAVELFTVAWSGILPFFTGLWDGVLVNFRAARDLWIGAWGEIVSAFEGIWASVWQGIAAGFERWVAPILDKAMGLVNVVRTVGRIALGTADESGGAVPTVAPGEGGMQIVSPQARAAAANADAAAGAGGSAKVGGTITVEAKPGTKATAKATPKAPALVVKPSGAFTP